VIVGGVIVHNQVSGKLVDISVNVTVSMVVGVRLSAVKSAIGAG
jgi:hypothetical protein